MPETLLSHSQIKLYGREFIGLILAGTVPTDPSESRSGIVGEDNAGEITNDTLVRLREQEPNGQDEAEILDDGAGPSANFDSMTNQLLRDEARLARIYAFSYEGRLYSLPKPSIYLVHGPGAQLPDEFRSRVDQTGLATRDWVYEDDVRYWKYDRVNYSLRCDICTGTLDEILIDAVMQADSRNSLHSDLSARGTDMASRGTDMASRGTDMASRTDLTSRHRIR